MNSGRQTPAKHLPNSVLQEHSLFYPSWPGNGRGLAWRTLLMLHEAVPTGDGVFTRLSDAELQLGRETLDLLQRSDAATTA